MSWRDNFRIALGGISSDKLRSALTMLGVLIGVGAVILLVAVGNGSSQAIESRIDSLGTNTLTVSSTGSFGGHSLAGATESQSTTLTTTDLDALENKADVPDVRSASPVVTASETATFDGSDVTTDIEGTTPSYLSAEDYTVAAGRNITSTDVARHSRVIVIGSEVASELFAGEDPLGQDVQIGSTQFQVVGVLASKGSSSVGNEDTISIAPYTSVEDELAGYTSGFGSIILQAKSNADVDAAEAEAESALAEATDTTVAELPFEVTSTSSLLSTAESTSGTFTVLLGAVAGISLFVGGIGVMNIMLVTVTERTREIGIRKAIGAPKGVILAQFLIEAVLVSMLGGAIGVVLGIVGAHFKIDGIKPVVAPYSVALAFGVAIAVGVFFGFYPANRAASLRPIDALRYE